MNKPRLEDKDKVAKVYNSKGEVCETFSFRDHGNSYLSAAQNYLMQNYDKLMAEEVEQMDEVSRSLAGRYIGAASEKEKEERKKDQEFVQQMRDAGMKGIGTPLRHKGPYMGKSSREAMIKLAINKLTNPDFPVSDRVKVPATESVEQMDEGNKENKKKKNEYVSNIIKKKLSPEVLPSLKYGRRELKKEKVEQMDEVAPPGREKQVKALKGKVDNPYAVAWASYNKSKAETKSENTMYNNMLTKLEEGRGRPPKPGSEAWKRRQSAAAAGGAHVETPHIATQLMKHADYGFKNHTYKFSDGSTHEITPTQRDTVLRKLRSMTGPGKKPEDREKMYDEINTPTGFFHHTGDKPIASKKLHPMSAQKE